MNNMIMANVDWHIVAIAVVLGFLGYFGSAKDE